MRPANLRDLLFWSVIAVISSGFISQFVAAQEIAYPPYQQGFDSDAASVQSILDDYEAYRLAHRPSEAARLQGRLPRTWRDLSPEKRAQEFAQAQSLLARTTALGSRHTIDTAILESLLTSVVAANAFDPDRVPFTGDFGFYSEATFVIGRARIRSQADADDLIARIDAIPAWFDQHIANMRRGMATGVVAHVDPTATMVQQVREQVVEDPQDSVLFRPFEDLPDSISPGDAVRIRTEAASATIRAVNAYRRLLAFMEREYVPAARIVPGIVSLPGGRDQYRALVIQHTTRPDLTPEKVHEIGQAEVARIRAQMEQVIAETDFEGTFSEFLEFLRTDQQFYPPTPNALMAEAAVLAKKLDATLPRFFGKLPRLPYGISPVPADIAPGYTTGRYVGGDAAIGRSGTYLVNTYRLDQRPLYQLPALTAHEAVPGHHLQIALAQELEDVPEFRRSYYATAFGEGWGLYAERLAGEAGIYDTPYKKFGALSYEMWRACRLVADTGLHWYGWTRDEAESCFRENSALSELNIKTEVTRYIGWPGQALGYKIGEITIGDLRAEAELALGEQFDLRDFHDLVLSEGAIPLTLLENRVRNWIEDEREEIGETSSHTAP
ncbi:MAG: DUF885 domain-containing protein [Pseudomonadota bacterium]